LRICGLDGITWYGQHDAHWIAYYDVYARAGLARYPREAVERLGLWAELARTTGWWWPRRGPVHHSASAARGWATG
jgi:hypothetical protein